MSRCVAEFTTTWSGGEAPPSGSVPPPTTWNSSSGRAARADGDVVDADRPHRRPSARRE